MAPRSMLWLLACVSLLGCHLVIGHASQDSTARTEASAKDGAKDLALPDPAADRSRSDRRPDTTLDKPTVDQPTLDKLTPDPDKLISDKHIPDMHIPDKHIPDKHIPDKHIPDLPPLVWTSQSISTFNLRAVWGSSPSHVVIVGDGGKIYVRSGTNLYGVASGTSSTLTAVWGTSPTDVYVVGLFSTALHFGGTWAMMGVPASGHSGVWGAGASEVFVVGTTTSVYKGYASGSWSALAGTVDSNMGGIHGISSPLHIYAVGTSGGIYQYQGVSVSPLPAPYTGIEEPNNPKNLYAVFVADAQNVFIAGIAANGLYFIYRYDGTSWSRTATPQICRALWGSSATAMVAAGDQGLLMRRIGTSWVIDPVNTAVNLRGVWGSGPEDIYVVGDAGTVLHYSR
jgi:hypothetical protein